MIDRWYQRCQPRVAPKRRVTMLRREGGTGLVYSTEVSRHINAPRPAVYRALLDADAVARWRVPDGMSSRVNEFDPSEGGAFRVSLTYDAPAGAGKTSQHTDAAGGTDIHIRHDGIPDKVPAADNETGTRMSLANLARLVEAA